MVLISNNVSLGGWLVLTLILTYTFACTGTIAQARSNTNISCTRDTGPTAITAASWSDTSKALPTLAKRGFNKIDFVTRDGKLLVAHIYRPSRFDPVNGPIWFVMHGVKRNADYYLETAAPVAERYQALTIAIEFSHRHYPTSEDYTLGITMRGRVGARAAREGRYHKPDAYLYNEVERVFEAVRLTLDGKQRGYYLFGHSAGAQFTHRMLTFLPCARVLGAVAANAGWYSLPIVDTRKRFGMPYSLRGSPEGVDLGALLSAPLMLLLGTRDIKGPDADRNLRKKPAAMAQGIHRLARGRYYFETGKSLARSLDVSFAWQLFLAPGAEHDVRQVIASAGHLLFASKTEPVCVSNTAVEADKLVFHEMMVDPSAGTASDANHDSVFHTKHEQFIEIVNIGNVPVCLSGWTIEGTHRPGGHLFPLGRALAPGKALIVFGGGIPTDKFGSAIVQRSTSTNGLNLDPDGDILTLRDGSGRTVKRFSWGHCGDLVCSDDHWHGSLHLGSSLVRWPNPDGQWQVHRQVADIPMSPGLKSNGDIW